MIDDVIGDPWEMLGILKRESQSVLEEMKDYLSHLCPEYLERLYLGPQYNLGDEFMHPSPGEIRKNLSCLVFRGQSDAEKPPIDTASRNHGSSDIEYWRFVS